jgi:hypothetical protein
MTYVIACNCTGITWGSTSKSSILVGNRLAFAPTVNGIGCNMVGNQIGGNITAQNGVSLFQLSGNNVAGSLTLDAGAVTVSADESNQFQGGVIDNSAQTSNRLYYEADFTPTWGADTANPSLGNGSLTGRAQRRGKTITAEIVLVMGSTTTFGAGPWFFQLPAPFNLTVKKNAVGSVTGQDSSAGATGNFCGNCLTAATIAPKFYILGGNAGAAFWGATAPITWATSDAVVLTATWEIG